MSNPNTPRPGQQGQQNTTGKPQTGRGNQQGGQQQGGRGNQQGGQRNPQQGGRGNQGY